MKIKATHLFTGVTVEVIEDDGSLKTYDRYGPKDWREVDGDCAYDMHEDEERALEAAYQEYVGKRIVIVMGGERCQS